MTESPIFSVSPEQIRPLQSRVYSADDHSSEAARKRGSAPEQEHADTAEAAVLEAIALLQVCYEAADGPGFSSLHSSDQQRAFEGISRLLGVAHESIKAI
ncbi:hypothetical protein [Allosphingosinicella deserti]|uniref:Uncharacterized protein n=1 Tax=Allosphingosinicella deserti TaxID=2116704 RepID=A0A2P7QW04_9SPHN|nr:hypothetical protein [Sphingomonas deserti]PSJ42133.1 hypothetical protein C7I55_07825 [Sphingomonas deserti]